MVGMVMILAAAMWDGQALRIVCVENPRGECATYIEAVSDTLDFLRSRGVSAPCVRPNTSLESKVRTVRAYLDIYPLSGNRPASEAVIDSLQVGFPCY